MGTEDKGGSCLSGVLLAERASLYSFRSIVVAYEPVWAIGTGKVATSAQVIIAFLSLILLTDHPTF
jgi:triosephosphate isomerase